MMIQAAKTRTRSTWEVRRRIRVPGLRDEAGRVAAEEVLAGIDGVVQVTVKAQKPVVVVDYLLTKTDYPSLERALDAAGLAPAAGRWARFKSGWYQNLDLTGRDNASAPAPACCSRPPSVPSGPHRH
jgi:hypothetical protein